MEIREINSKEVWETFLAELKPASFLQSWNWAEFNTKTGHNVLRLGIYENEILIAVAMVLKVTAKRGSFMFAPHINLPTKFDLQVMTKALTSYLIPIAKKEKCAFIRLSPLVENSAENNQAFIGAGYKESPTHMMHPEHTWILDIRPSEAELLAGMRKTTRYSIKKAEKDGVIIKSSANRADLDKFLAVYDTTVKRQEFKPFSREYFSTEAEIFLRDNQALLFFAEYQGEIVGSAFIVFYGDSAFYHHGATTRKFEKLTDAQALQWEAIKEAKRRGLSFYNFWGVVSETAIKHPWFGLSTFKRGFGGFEKNYVHAKDYVLSSRYWITYLIEYVRKIKRGL
jgi:lipid II:glycine glycyltransferase (peptidoglycan interpeptide bridge formation enzyme)